MLLSRSSVLPESTIAGLVAYIEGLAILAEADAAGDP